jgi:ABC-type Fe3+ transport system substrate-binding protein
MAMTDVDRRKFLKLVGAAVTASTLLEYSEFLPNALGKTKLPPPTPLKTLIKKGQAEGGSLLFYVASSDLGDALAAGFKAAYPWATLNTLIAPTGTIFTKVLTEVSAKSGADVYTVTPVQPYLYIRANACTPVALVSDQYLPKGSNDPSGHFHPYAENVQVICSNPNLATYVPKDILELAEPAFKGQFCIDKPANLSTGALFLAAQRKNWGDKKWFAWLQGMQANNLMLTTSGAAAYQAVLIGQRGMCTDTIADVLSQPAGAPVKANFYKNAPPYRQSLMMSSYTSKPNMSQLFMNWTISPAGQKVIASTNRTPVVPIPGAPTSESTLVPKQYPVAPYSEISGFVYNPQPYIDIFNKYWPS